MVFEKYTHFYGCYLDSNKFRWVCKKFSDLPQADKFCNEHPQNLATKVVPVCKYSIPFFDRFVLSRDLPFHYIYDRS